MFAIRVCNNSFIYTCTEKKNNYDEGEIECEARPARASFPLPGNCDVLEGKDVSFPGPEFHNAPSSLHPLQHLEF